MKKIFYILVFILFMFSSVDAKEYLYVSNSLDSTISVIDTGRNVVVATIPVGNNPVSIAVHPSGKEAYVANYGEKSLSVIDTLRMIESQRVNLSGNPSAIALSADGNTLYLLEYSTSQLVFIDVATKVISFRMSVGHSPDNIILEPTGRYAYINNRYANRVTIVDLLERRIFSTISLFRQPSGAALDNDGTKLYIPTFFAHGCYLNIIDTITQQLIALNRYFIPCVPTAIATIPRTDFAIIVNSNQNNATIYDVKNGYKVGTIQLGSSPVNVTVNKEGTKVYVANTKSHEISVITTSTLSVDTTISVGKEPKGLALGPILDVTPPELKLTLPDEQKFLWPPNGKFVKITPIITVVDDTDPNPTVKLISITSSEPTNSIFYDGVEFDVDDREFYLRAERSGKSKDGRTYTVTYLASDSYGNQTTATLTIIVPHDQSGKSK